MRAGFPSIRLLPESKVALFKGEICRSGEGLAYCSDFEDWCYRACLIRISPLGLKINPSQRSEPWRFHQEKSDALPALFNTPRQAINQSHADLGDLDELGDFACLFFKPNKVIRESY